MYELSLAICSAVLLSASYQDWKKREVDDVCWTAVCVAGSVLIFLEDRDALRLAGCLLLTALMLSERLSGWMAVPPAAAAIVCMALTGDASSMMVPLMFFSVYFMYAAGILRGGADAKAIMSVAVAFPFYPDHVIIPPLYPAGYVFCPCFSVLSIALGMTLVWMLMVAVRNFMHGRGLSISKRMSLDEAERSFVWPIEDVVDGNKVKTGPNDDQGIYARMRDSGYDEVEVTWKIPFIVPITASFLTVMTVGSPLFLLV